MSRRHAFAATILALAWLLSPARFADAQKMYKWTDKDGKVHFSNVAPPGEEDEEPSGTQGVEASGSLTTEPASAPPPPSAPSESAVAAETGVSDEAFSSRASATRTRLRREIAAAKTEVTEKAEKLERLKKERDAAQRVGLEMLQRAFSPDQHPASEEDDLRDQKAKAEKRVEDIRAEYAKLRDEAVKRNNGTQPGWWLPIE